MTVYDGNGFKNFQFKEALSQSVVLSIAEDRSNQIWFATDGGGLVYLDDTRFNYLVLPKGEDNNYIRSICIDDRDNIWLATRNGLSIIDSQKNIKDTIPDVNATQVFVDSENNVWCSTYGKGVLQLGGGLCVEHNVKTGLISNHIRGFVKRKDGSFWFVSKKGVSKYSKGEVKNFTKRDGLNNSNIKVNCYF